MREMSPGLNGHKMSTYFNLFHRGVNFPVVKQVAYYKTVQSILMFITYIHTYTYILSIPHKTQTTEAVNEKIICHKKEHDQIYDQ